MSRLCISGDAHGSCALPYQDRKDCREESWRTNATTICSLEKLEKVSENYGAPIINTYRNQKQIFHVRHCRNGQRRQVSTTPCLPKAHLNPCSQRARVSFSNVSLPSNCTTSGKFLDQTSSCTATVSHEGVLYEQLKEYYDTHGAEDSNEPELERVIDHDEQCEKDEETFNSSETREFTNEIENDLDADEEYLDALCGEENPVDNKQVNEDDDRDILASGCLYNGAPITVGVSMLLIITFAVRHSLTGVAVVDLLTLVSLHCALPHQCASSMELLKKFFMKLKNPIQFHYYCTFCMEYQGLCIDENGLCKNKACLKNLKEKGNSSYFIIIPLICQLRDLIQSK